MNRHTLAGAFMIKGDQAPACTRLLQTEVLAQISDGLCEEVVKTNKP